MTRHKPDRHKPDRHEADRSRHLDGASQIYATVTADERRQRRPLPDTLAQRLRDLASSSGETAADRLDCDQVMERLAEDPKADAPAVRQHLEDCAECRQLFGPLQQVATEPSRSMPAGLRRRLLAIPAETAGAPDAMVTSIARPEQQEQRLARSHGDGPLQGPATVAKSRSRPADGRHRRRHGARSDRHPRGSGRPLPWFHDARKVAMVCYTLTAVVMGLVGDLPEHFRNASQLAGEQATEWVASGGEEGTEITESVAHGLVAGVDQGRHWMRLGGETWGRWVRRTGDTLRKFSIPNSESTIDPEGESDGTAPANPS